jgi:hypothetical protein
LFARASHIEKDVDKQVFTDTAFSSDDPESIRLATLAITGTTNILGSIERYLSGVNSLSMSTSRDKKLESLRFEPPFTLNSDALRKSNIRQTLFPYYRHKNSFAHWAFTNYQCLNFFSASNIPTGSAIIYDNGVVSGTRGPYTPDTAFSLECYINPKYQNLKSTQEYRQANQETKNLLAASLIQSRNYKEDTIKGEKTSQIGGTISTFDAALKKIDDVQNHPGRYNGADVIGAAASHVPNTDAYDYKASLQGLKDIQFMASIAGIKGTGIGRILLPEVSKIQNSTGVLDTHQSKAQFDQQLNNLRNMLTAAKARAIGSANQYGISPQDLGIVK